MGSLGVDFFVFSGHKIFAPTGIGVVYGRPEDRNGSVILHGVANLLGDGAGQGHRGVAAGEAQLLERQRGSHPEPAQGGGRVHQDPTGGAVTPADPPRGSFHSTVTAT
jgi:hypothetical protein